MASTLWDWLLGIVTFGAYAFFANSTVGTAGVQWRGNRQGRTASSLLPSLTPYLSSPIVRGVTGCTVGNRS
jgi:hypothetical protein